MVAIKRVKHMTNIIADKIKNITEKFGLLPSHYLTEALLIASYSLENQKGHKNNLQIVENKNANNRALANVGDRFLKLVLAEEGYKNWPTAKQISDFTNRNESNINLAELGILSLADGYCMKGNHACEFPSNKKDSTIIKLATFVEAIIGAIYLDEYEKTGTAKTAREFIKKHIIFAPKI